MTVHGFTFQGDTLEVYEELKCMTFLVNPEKLGHLDLLFLLCFLCVLCLGGWVLELGFGDSYNGRLGEMGVQ